MTSWRWITAAVLLSLALAGVGGVRIFTDRRAASDAPDSSTPSFTFPLPTGGGSAGWPTCTNGTLGITVSYPPGWHTVAPSPEQACRWFDPRPFAVPGGEGPLTAVEIYRDNEGFETAWRG